MKKLISILSKNTALIPTTFGLISIASVAFGMGVNTEQKCLSRAISAFKVDTVITRTIRAILAKNGGNCNYCYHKQGDPEALILSQRDYEGQLTYEILVLQKIGHDMIEYGFTAGHVSARITAHINVYEKNAKCSVSELVPTEFNLIDAKIEVNAEPKASNQK